MIKQNVNQFRRPVQVSRRLTTTPGAGEWKSLLNYWAETGQYPGYIPEDYPGEPMPSQAYDDMLREAVKYLGYNYQWGGKTPPYFDCSGFVGWCYKYAGIMPQSVVSYTATIVAWCTPMPEGDEPKPGYICYWKDPKGDESNAHVAIYIGNGYIIDAAGPGVDYRPVTWHYPSWFRGYYVPPNYPNKNEG